MFEPDSKVPEKFKGQVLGAEACLWSEYVTEQNVYQKMSPRVFVFGEKMWNQKGTIPWDTVVRKSVDFENLLIDHGLYGGKATSRYCQVFAEKCFHVASAMEEADE